MGAISRTPDYRSPPVQRPHFPDGLRHVVYSGICSLCDDVVASSTGTDADGIYRRTGRADDHAWRVRTHADDAFGRISIIQIRRAPDDRVRALNPRSGYAFHGAPIQPRCGFQNYDVG